MDRLRRGAAVLVTCSALSLVVLHQLVAPERVDHIPVHAEQTIGKCRSLHALPGPPPGFKDRTESDRFVPGTRPTLLRNATLWTGRDGGLEVVHGDLLIDGGIIKGIGSVDVEGYGDELDIVDVAGAWVSPGIVDLHSHMGDEPMPAMTGASDGNSFLGSIQPWLRSLDGLNTHDESYYLAVAGGMTTALILPGSANAIGGQAFTIKLRPTVEKSPSSMLLESPFHYNGSEYDPPRWRQMKHACGENPARVYHGTRMDTVWDFRTAYNTARQLKDKQDAYCEKALAGQWTGIGEFPDDLKWEALVDVLRGRVKVQNHCYEAVDIDGMVRLTNEFKFSIAAFHHAHEAYLVTDSIKKAYGPTPAAAIFAVFGRYKRESLRQSEYAPRILADAGIDVVMKTDHPLVNGRYLLHEAQQAHYYGLDAHTALSSVTSTPAKIMGMDHRVGLLIKGHDADVVVWDSHPLTLGATPKQVYIDGIAQLNDPYVVDKPASSQHVPKTPAFDQEAKDALTYDGLPPLDPKLAVSGPVVFINVGSVYIQRGGKVVELFAAKNAEEKGVVYVENGKMLCNGLQSECLEPKSFAGAHRIDLEGGSIAPGLVSVGTGLGLNEIQFESSTVDGPVFDILSGEIPAIVGEDTVIRAVDGLIFQTRDALIAYHAGVTTAVVSPVSDGLLSGLATAFSTGARHKLQPGAVVKDVSSVHVVLSLASSNSVSSQIAAMRRLLSGFAKGDLGEQFERVVKGSLPLVVYAHSADVMASMIALKLKTEERTGIPMRVTFVGATESYLIASEIAAAGVGVVVANTRPFPYDWESIRILPGPPLSQDTTIGVLLKHNVSVAIGIDPMPRGPLQSFTRNARLDAAWAAMEMDATLSTADTLALASVNVASLFGLDLDEYDLVATKAGSLLQFESKVVGVISSRRGITDIL